MTRAAIPNRLWWAHALFFSGLLAALAFAGVSGPLAPRPGWVEFTELARVPVPGGHVSAAGGNYLHERVDLALDTRLGPLAIGAVYNSVSGWMASVDASYQEGVLRDATGASIPLGTLAAGAAAPGTHWVKLDATRVKTKGGLVHVFDATTGRLVSIHYGSAPYPRLRFTQTQLAAQWRTSAVEQCTTATACKPVFTLSYDASARLVRIEDRAGRTALFSYDATGKLESARDGLDVENGWPGERYAYSGNFLASITSSEGERIEIATDEQGRTTLVRAVGAGDPTWRFDHGAGDAAGIYITTVTDPLGNATRYAIDGSLRVQSITNPLGELTSFGWAGLRPASRTLPDGTRTSWTWAADDLATETLPSGNVRTFTYQATGVDREHLYARPLLELRDSLGLVERRAYDANGRLTAITNGAGETVAVTYDASEDVASDTAPNGQVVRFTGYGDHGRPAFASFPNSTVTAVTRYDAVGNAQESTIPDPLSGGVTQRLYDADRNLAAIEVIDAPASGAPAVSTVRQEYRSDGQLLRTTRPYGGATTFSYDALGRLVAISEQVSPGAAPAPGAASVTTIARDLLGRAVAIERANGMREEVEFDAAGRVTRRRTLKSGVLENDLGFVYADGRLVRAYAPGRFDEAVAYDAAGRVSRVTHSFGEATRFSYDGRSRPTRIELVWTSGAPLATLTPGYDLADRETSLAYLGANLVSRSFVGGRLERTQYGNGVREDHFRTTQSGRAPGRELWRGSSRIAWSDYAVASVPGGETTQLRSEVRSGTPADGITQEDYAYASGQSGMKRRVVSGIGGGAEAIRYDALSNVTSSASPALASLVTYNAEHNRVLSAAHPQSGGLAPFTFTSTFAYDAAGFVTRASLAVGGAPLSHDEFAWSARGQITEIRSGGSLVASFEYDALGRRLARTIAGATQRWRFGGVVEANASGQPVAIDLGEVRIDLAGQHRYRHDDLRGNPKLVTDAAGRVVRHNVYTSYTQFGALGAQSDDLGFARGTPIGASAIGYLLIGARLYAPLVARFLAPDPVWNPINQYAYTLGNPVDFWDPAGLHSGPHWDVALGRLGLAGGLVSLAVAIVTFAAAPVGVPTVIAGLIVAGAYVNLARAMVEFTKQEHLHDAQTRAEGIGARESRGGGGGGAVSGGGRGADFTGRRDRGWRVCSDDGMGVTCTRSSGLLSGGFSQSWRLFWF